MGGAFGKKMIEWRPSAVRVQRHGRPQKGRSRGAEKRVHLAGERRN